MGSSSAVTVASWLLSRLAFVGTHIDFFYFLFFVSNDPLGLRARYGLPVTTLDALKTLPDGQCTTVDFAALRFDLLLLSAWWAQHSIMARKAFKQALGIWQHPIERPVFAISATVLWFVTIHFWRPISDCASQKWDPLNTSTAVWAVSGLVIALGSLLIVGLLWSLPSHVFGTDWWKYEQGKFPHGQLIRSFPYGLVRHPAAAGFLWIYWAVPSYTVNHLLLATFWTAFIVIGTSFEEGGLHGEDEFGKAYAAYRQEVYAYVPTVANVRAVVTGVDPRRSGTKQH